MSAPKQRYEYGSENFPILFERNGIRIYKNPTGEIFIKDVDSDVVMRLNRSHCPGGGLEFTTEGAVEPIRVTNTIAWRVYNRTR